ncbi:MAG: UDP-N-acetylmuramoyl-L-alanine--D-glutamate ligase [Rudaea sp.]
MRLSDLADSRVAVWGYGREGRAAAIALRLRYPRKPFTLFCSAAEADAAAADLRAPTRALGHAEASAAIIDLVTLPPDAATLARFDVVIKSPGISPYFAPYPEALAAGVHFTSGSALWFAEHGDARTICVTGTKGKSTVSALIAHLLRAGGRSVALAGNIGLPLLELAEDRAEDSVAPDWWVIELSSFQTRDFAGAPGVAVINNVYEEHLDWHATRANYVADKLAIAAHARRVVVNGAQAALAAVADEPTRSEFNVASGWHLRDDAIWRGAARVLPLAQVALPGRHNAENVCAALAAIDAAGEDAATLAPHVATFRALPHRLQLLGARAGIDFVNDSIATTPYAAIEALRSLDSREVTILVGGFDRGVSWQPFADRVAACPPHAIVAMGANRAKIADALHAVVQASAFESVATLSEALTRALALTRQGGVVLLSPGAPSFDQFRDYTERGREFARLAGFDAKEIAQIEGLGIA